MQEPSFCNIVTEAHKKLTHPLTMQYIIETQTNHTDKQTGGTRRI